MEDDEQHHDTKHQDCIKDVQEHLMRHEQPIITLIKLNDTEDRADQDKNACSVQCPHVRVPVLDLVHRGGRRGARESEVEDTTAEEEHAEEEDL